MKCLLCHYRKFKSQKDLDTHMRAHKNFGRDNVALNTCPRCMKRFGEDLIGEASARDHIMNIDCTPDGLSQPKKKRIRVAG